MKDYDMDTHNIITDILKHHLGGSVESGKYFGNIISATNSIKSPAMEFYREIFTGKLKQLGKGKNKLVRIAEIRNLNSRLGDIYKKVTNPSVDEEVKNSFIEMLKNINLNENIEAQLDNIKNKFDAAMEAADAKAEEEAPAAAEEEAPAAAEEEAPPAAEEEAPATAEEEAPAAAEEEAPAAAEEEAPAAAEDEAPASAEEEAKIIRNDFRLYLKKKLYEEPILNRLDQSTSDTIYNKHEIPPPKQKTLEDVVTVSTAVEKNKEDFNKFKTELTDKIVDYLAFLRYFLPPVDKTNLKTYTKYYDPIFNVDISQDNGLELLDEKIKEQKSDFVNDKTITTDNQELRVTIREEHIKVKDIDKAIEKVNKKISKEVEKYKKDLEAISEELKELLKKIDTPEFNENIISIYTICDNYSKILNDDEQQQHSDDCFKDLKEIFKNFIEIFKNFKDEAEKHRSFSNDEEEFEFDSAYTDRSGDPVSTNDDDTNSDVESVFGGDGNHQDSDDDDDDDDNKLKQLKLPHYEPEEAKKDMFNAVKSINKFYLDNFKEDIYNKQELANIRDECDISDDEIQSIEKIKGASEKHYNNYFSNLTKNTNYNSIRSYPINLKEENVTPDDTKPKEEKKEDEKAEEAKAEAEARNIKELLKILQDIHTNYEICASEENDSEDKFEEELGKIINILNKQNNNDSRIVFRGKSLLRNLQALGLKDEFKDLLKPLIEYITADNRSLRKQNADIEKQLNNAKENVKYHIIMHNIPKCIHEVKYIINKLIESMDKDTNTEPLNKLNNSLVKLEKLYNESNQPSQSGGQDSNGEQSTETNIQEEADKKIDELKKLIKTYNELMESIKELSQNINVDTTTLQNKFEEKKEEIKKIEKEINELTEKATKFQSKLKNEQKVKIINNLVKQISKELENFKSDKYEELYANAKNNNTGLPVDNKLHESVQKILSDKILETEGGLIGIKHLKDTELNTQLSELKNYTDKLEEPSLSTEQLLTIQVRINGIKYIADLFIDNKDEKDDNLDSISEIVVKLHNYIKDKVQNIVTTTYKILKEEYNKNYTAIKIARDNYKKFKNIKNDTDIKMKKLKDKLEYLIEYLYDTETSESIKQIEKSIKNIEESIKGNQSGDNDATGNADEEPKKSLNEINKWYAKINEEYEKINGCYKEAEEAKICADKLDTQKLNQLQNNKKAIGMTNRITEGLKNLFNRKTGGDEGDNEATLDELEELNKIVNSKYPALIEHRKYFNKIYNEIMDKISTLEKDRLFKINESLKKVDSFFSSLEDLMFKYKPLRYEFYRLMNEDANTREHFRALRKALVILNKKQKQEQNEDKKLSLTILQILNSSPNIDKAIERINANMDDIVEIKNNSKTGGAEMQYMPQQQYSLLNMGSNNEMNKEVDKTRNDEKEKEVDKTLKNIHIPKTLDDMRNMLKELKGKYNTYNATVNKLKEVDEKKVDEKEVVETKLIKSKIENQEAYILKIIDYVKKGLNAITDKHIAEFDNLKDNKYISIELDKYKNSVDKIKEDLINLGEKIDTKFIKQTSNDEKDNIVNENIDPIIKSLNELNNIYQDVSKRKDKIEDPVKYASLEYGNENIFNKLYNNYADKKDVNPDQAIDELVVRMDNNNLIPSKVLSVDLRDKIVFIFATLFIRLFSLSVIESLIEKGVIRDSKFSITGYLGLFSILLLAFTLFVNLDMYRMRIVFNYVNFHSNGTNMLLYILMLWVFGGIVYYITYQINKDLPEQNKTDLGKLRLIYRIQIISLITWIFLSLIVIIL